MTDRRDGESGELIKLRAENRKLREENRIMREILEEMEEGYVIDQKMDDELDYVGPYGAAPRPYE